MQWLKSVEWCCPFNNGISCPWGRQVGVKKDLFIELSDRHLLNDVSTCMEAVQKFQNPISFLLFTATCFLALWLCDLCDIILHFQNRFFVTVDF